MKKILLIAIALFTINGFAQGERKDKMGHKGMSEKTKDMSPEEIASIRSKRLTLHLTLDEKQQSQVYNLMLAEAKDREQIKEKRKENKTKDVKLSKEELATFQNSRLDKQIAYKRKIKSILSDEQFAKYEAFNSKRGRKKSKQKKKKRK